MVPPNLALSATWQGVIRRRDPLRSIARTLTFVVVRHGVDNALKCHNTSLQFAKVRQDVAYNDLVESRQSSTLFDHPDRSTENVPTMAAGRHWRSSAFVKKSCTNNVHFRETRGHGLGVQTSAFSVRSRYEEGG